MISEKTSKSSMQSAYPRASPYARPSSSSVIGGLSSSPAVTRFDDDEPLASHPPPPTPHPSSSPPPTTTTIKIKTFPEFTAVAASDSPSDFAVLIKARAPPAPPRPTDRTPIDLVAVLDVSGSMFGHKFALLKRAVRFIIANLGPSDRLSLVAFSSAARRVHNLLRISDAGRARASLAVDSLKAGGGTNILAGLETGVQILDQRRHRNPVSGLILLSDGVDSFRIRGQSEQEYLRLLPAHTLPIHTFGFGWDHDPRALHAISAASGGTFSFVEAEGGIQDAFAMCIGGLLSVVAQQAELMVSSATAGVQIKSVESGNYRSRILNHGLAAVVEVSDLYADEEKDFLFQISIPVSVMELLTVKCSYMDPMTQKAIHVEGEAAEIRRPEQLLPDDRAVSRMVDGQRNRFLVSESIREAQARAERGQLEGAKSVLAGRRAALVASVSGQAGDELCGWLDAELQEIEKRMANMSVYEQSGRAYALSGMSSHSLQRASMRVGLEVSDGGEDVMESDDWACKASRKRVRIVMAGGAETTSGGANLKMASRVVGYQTPAMAAMLASSKAFENDRA